MTPALVNTTSGAGWHARLVGAAPWPVLAAGIIGLLLCFSAPWRSLELKAFDWFTVHTAPDRVSLPITIVAIDEESMANVGLQWPWPRSLHARLLDRLRDAGAAVVAFDVVFAEPSAEPQEDRLFAQAIREFGSVVLAANLEYRDTAATRQWIRIDPLPALLDAGATAGLATIKTDPDGFQRSIPMSENALWREVLAKFAQRHPGVVARTQGTESERIRYVGGAGTFVRIPYYRLLDPDKYLSANWREALRDNIVLVGRSLKTTTDLNIVQPDMFMTPFFSTTQELMPGVEVQANIIANMITGDTLSEAPRYYAILLVIAATLLVALTMPSWQPLHSGLWALGLGVAIALADWYLFRYQRVWLPAGAALSVVALGYAGQGARGFLREQARRKEIRRAFALYVSPEIVDEIVAHPESLRLGGDRRELTLLFTDLAGFTSISEKLSAEAVAQLLNRHLTEMTAIVMRHGGTVDKFIGDAVMAFWGAPIADADQSLHAVEAAIEMQRAIADMRAKLAAAGSPALHMRIGLHRGECIVGNMGSIDRFAYTAVGDCVNLASRLEGVNNVYGTGILLSDAVAHAVADRISLRPVDTVRVKGKQQPVALFTPCADPALVAQTVAALARYTHAEWAPALAQWENLAAAYPEDPVARIFIARLRLWSAQGWPQSWDGVTTLGAK